MADVLPDEGFLKQFWSVFLDSYFVVDQDRKIQAFNPAFTQMAGLSSAQKRQLVGSHCYEHLQLEVCEKNCIALQCLEKGTSVRMEEIKGKTADGRDLILEMSAVPVRDNAGKTTGVFVTHRDVTDERRLKERYLEEGRAHKKERTTLLHIIEEREQEIQHLKRSQK